MTHEYPSTPLVGVGVVVVKEEKVLLIRRANPPRQGDWSLPGGKQQLGETVAAAAEREVREETGIEIKLLGLVDVIDSINRDDQKQIKYHYTLIDFAACWVSGTPAAADDASDAAWFSLEEIPALNLWKETNRIIGKAMILADTKRNDPTNREQNT